MPTNRLLSNSTTPTSATPPLPSKSAASSSTILIPAATSSPSAKAIQPTASHIQSPNASVSVPAVITSARSAMPSSSSTTNSSSFVIDTSNSASNVSIQAELPNGGSNNLNSNSSDHTSSVNRLSTGMITAFALSGAVLILASLVLMKVLSSHMRRRKGTQRLRDTFIVVPTDSAPPHPRNQECGGVGASPTTLISSSNFNSYSRSSNSRSDSQKSQSIIYSNHRASYLDYPRRESLGTMPCNLFVESKTWDGSRPTRQNDYMVQAHTSFYH